MELRSGLEKDGALLNDMRLLENIVHRLQNVCLIDLIVMVEEIFKGTMTGIQATEVNLNARHKDVTGPHLDGGAHPGMNAGGVGAGRFLRALVVAGTIAEALCAVPVLQTGALCLVTG